MKIRGEMQQHVIIVIEEEDHVRNQIDSIVHVFCCRCLWHGARTWFDGVLRELGILFGDLCLKIHPLWLLE